MDELMVTIPLATYTELTVAAADGDSLKRILREKLKCYSSLEYKAIYDLCVMFGLMDEVDGE
jgi:hypothetical protein